VQGRQGRGRTLERGEGEEERRVRGKGGKEMGELGGGTWMSGEVAPRGSLRGVEGQIALIAIYLN
jgi:hypothetical protein